MASGLKVIAALGADAEKSEEKAEEPAEDEAATEEDADVEVQLDAIEEPVEDVDKEQSSIVYENKKDKPLWFVLFQFADIICVICMYLGFAQTGFYKVEDLVLGYAQDG